MAPFFDDTAIMDVSLLHISLAIVSSFLLIAGYLVVYDNPNQISLEVKTVASRIESVFYEVDSYWFEQEKTIMFPTSTIPITAYISNDYILVRSTNNNIKTIIPVPQRLWIAEEPIIPWRNASSWHQEIFNRTGQYGTRLDPSTNETLIHDFIFEQWRKYQPQFHEEPFLWSKERMVTLEKCIIFKENVLEGETRVVPLVEFVIVRSF
ncbi:MAG: hypothetical protein QCI00_01555 [Candidatus Thermoplasmatota archaeon]|nr:hypothetical protein [Candidatus Thermoplasmatota archaeon]